MNGCRYGPVARKDAGIQDSGERKLAASVEMVFNIVHEGRERKLRSAKVMMTGRKVEKILGLMERPKGRRRRKGRKGEACKERRRATRRLEWMEKGGSSRDEGTTRERPRISEGLSAKAKVFSPAYTRSGRMFRSRVVDPPLPMTPEPGSELFRTVAEGVLRDVKTTGDDPDGEGGGAAAAFTAERSRTLVYNNNFIIWT